MNKTLKVIGIVIVLAAVIIAVQFFSSTKKVETSTQGQIDTIVVKDKVNYIIENLNHENVLNEFSDKNFPDKKEIKTLISDISTKCDWKKRQGGLTDSYTTKNIDGVDQIAYIYAFKLDCGQLNFIMTFNMYKEKPELFRFDFEPFY